MKEKKLQWSALLMALLLMFSLAACGGSSNGASYESAKGSYTASESAYDSYGYYDADVAEEAAYDGGEVTNTTSSGSTADAQQAQDAQDSGEKAKVKIIYTANLNVEALDLNAAVSALNQLVEETGGYFQSSDRGTSGRSRYASYTVRVPSAKYRTFLDAWSDNENIKLTSIHEDTEDVGVRYFDLETHLTTLRNKLNRLQALLEQAIEMEDIIQLESAISDTEYQINLYTSDLNRYDSLINYSTINLRISEVVKLEEPEEISFLQRLGQNLRWGVRDFGEALGDFIIWFAYNLIGIIIFVVIVVLIVRWVRRRRANRPKVDKPRKPARRWRFRGRNKQQDAPAQIPAADDTDTDADTDTDGETDDE